MLTARFLSVISGVSQLAPKQGVGPGDKTAGGKEKRKGKCERGSREQNPGEERWLKVGRKERVDLRGDLTQLSGLMNTGGIS